VQLDAGQASFISDCGVPTDFEKVLICDNCTMCCNSQDNCYPTKNISVQEIGYKNYLQFIWVFFVSILGASCVLHIVSFGYGEYQKRGRQAVLTNSSDEESRGDKDRDKKYALETVGLDSVYMFFVTNSIWGWLVALATMAVQLGILFIFLEGAEFDLSDDLSDWVYTWKCPRDRDSCKDTTSVSWRGWLCFAILMAAHLLKDLVNGTKLLVLSGKQRHSVRSRIRFFCGGMFLLTISLFTIFVTTVYNMAIATSNTALIENSVIVLFITDLDEMLYGAMLAINRRWVTVKTTEEDRQQQNSEDGRLKIVTAENEEIKADMKEIQIEMEKLRGIVERMQSAQDGAPDKSFNIATAQDEGPPDDGPPDGGGNSATTQDHGGSHDKGNTDAMDTVIGRGISREGSS